LVNAALDLLKTDVTAGLSRLAYALMILVSAAAALIVVTWVVGIQPEPLLRPPLNPVLFWILSAATSWIGVTGWAIMFNSRLSGAVIAGCIGLVANLVRLTLLELGAPIWLGATIGCFIIGLLAHFAARRPKLSYATLAVPAAIIMVPGASAYRALIGFYEGNAQALISNSSTAIITLVGLAIGLSMARILTERSWALDKRRALGDD
jgi:uncharacterized membrane protein YjjB (DUF3815 family)